MNKIHFYNFLKYSASILILYNIFSLFVLFTSNYSIKSSFWKFTPYSYKQIMSFPNYYQDLSLKNFTNRDQINQFLNKNKNKNILNIDFWNYKLILDNYSKETNTDFEKSFINLFFLTKNNNDKNLDLKKYFFKNYKFFSEKSKNKILELLKETN